VTFFREALAAGVRHIDTAHLYTGGESERAIGETIQGGLRGRARHDEGRKVLVGELGPGGEPTRPGRRRTFPRGPNQASV
jgi:hypothetical protein